MSNHSDGTMNAASRLEVIARIQELEARVLDLVDQLFELRVSVVAPYVPKDVHEGKAKE